MKLREFFFDMFLIFFLTLLLMWATTSIAIAQFDSDSSYEVTVEVPVVKENFVQARKKAVKMALKSALQQDLREFLGNDKFDRNQLEIKRMLNKSEKYVKSYRFLEASDDLIRLVSQIKLEVVLFKDAINNYLGQIGVVTGLDAGKKVVILINESSFNTDSKLHFWETMPISEASLARNFIEEGIPVVRREIIRYAIPEEIVRNAMKGDLSSAVNIGLKAGADIVIVGNATSTIVKNRGVDSQQPIRVAISIKVISSHHAKIVAAKSDFSTVTRNEVLSAELEAFHHAGKKMTSFLIPAIQKYWKTSNAKKEFKNLEPAVKTDSLPIPWGNL